MKKLLLITFVLIGMALALGETFLYIVQPHESLPAWLPVTVGFLLFSVIFAVVGCVELKPHLHETAGWVGLLLLACLGGVAACMRVPEEEGGAGPGVEIGIFAVYAVVGVIGAKMAMGGRAAA